MLNFDNAGEILRLKKKLSDYKWRRRKKKSEIEEMEDAIKKLQKKRREIEEGLQETSNTIKKWLDRLPSKCKFRVTYYENAKSKFLNPRSSSALDHTYESERTAKRKLLALEDDLEALDRKIRNTEEQIRRLSEQAD